MPELTQDQKDHAVLIARNMTMKWLVEQLTDELYGSLMSSTAGQLLLALNIKTHATDEAGKMPGSIED